MTAKKTRNKARRELQKQDAQRSKRMRGGVVAIILIVVGLVVMQVRNSQLPDVDLDSIPDNSVTYDNQGRDHSPDGTFIYNSNPPTSGPHSGAIPTGVYLREQIDINMIHNLEHGHIWYSYRDADDQEAIDLLSELQRTSSSMVVVTHRPDNDSRVVAAAWTRLLEMEDELNRDELLAFLVRYINKSPESVPG